MSVWRAFQHRDLVRKCILDGFNKLCAMAGEVLQRHKPAFALDELNDGFSDSALVIPILAVLSDRTEGLCQVGQFHNLPLVRSLAIDQHLVTIRRGGLYELLASLPLEKIGEMR